ncbi:MAG: hypothetical protein E7489_04475 [Ruminococcaceae bacterium]|nr:hypothetical protein [Oscillospiraceae bacterium]
MKKSVFYKEAAYIFGIVFIALGVALAAKSDLGVSMIAGPVYTLYLWIGQFTEIITFGTIDYSFQGIVILLAAVLVKKFRLSYLFSFATAVISGFTIDFFFWLFEFFPAEGIFIRAFFFCASLISCAFGVACIFHSYFPPAGHELFVKEFSIHFGKDMHKVKTIYDIVFCFLSVFLNLVLFGGFVGIGIGTVITAFINGPLIGKFTHLIEKHFEFKAALPKLEDYFEK